MYIDTEIYYQYQQYHHHSPFVWCCGSTCLPPVACQTDLKEKNGLPFSQFIHFKQQKWEVVACNISEPEIKLKRPLG